MKRERLTAILLLSALTLAFIAWSNASGTPYTNVVGDGGVWDLRDFDFGSGNAKIVGAVRYIPNALLTPEEFAARENESVIGYPEEAGDCATGKLTVLLPNGYYSFYKTSIDFAEKLYIDGEWFTDIGNPSETRETNVPDTGLVKLTVHVENGVTEIVSQGSVFVHREGGGYAGWFIGPPGAEKQHTQNELAAAMVAGCYLAFFIVHIMLYALLRRYRANLCFALLCLTWFLRSGVTSYKIFGVIFPWLGWTAKFRIEYLTLPVTAALVVALFVSLFPGILQQWFRYAVYGASAAAAGVFLFADTLFMSYAILPVYAVYAPAALYIVAVFARKLRNIKTEQAVFVVGTVVFSFSFLVDMLFYTNVVHTFHLLRAERSMLVFVFYAAVAVFIATVREVEEAKEREQRLAAENALLDSLAKMKTEYLANISHEIKTPLTVISVHIQRAAALSEIGGDAGKIAASLARAQEEAMRVARLTENALRFASMQESKSRMESMDISELLVNCAEAYRALLEKRGNKLAVSVPDGLPAVRANADLTLQVLANLLSNANRHTADGEITVRAELSGGFVAVTVSDDGNGIPPELLPRVFERGVGGGTGLGMAICKYAVESFGGAIAATNNPEKGASVTFTVPVFYGKPES
jgi:signal transduction histidine kinase